MSSVLKDLQEILTSTDRREQAILWGRFSPTAERTTLEDIGQSIGLTRERIRQIEARLVRRLRVTLTKNSQLSRRYESLRAACVHAVNIEFVEQLLSCSFEENAELLKLFLGIATILNDDDHYEINAGYVFFGSNRRFNLDLSDWLRGREPADVSAILSAAKIALFPSDLVRKFLNAGDGIVLIEGKALVLEGALPERICAVLKYSKVALSVKKLANYTNGAVASVRNVLNSDIRFRRVDVYLYGLTIWKDEEYTSIDALITKVIREDGGHAFADKIVNDIIRKYSVSGSSVRIALSHLEFEWDRSTGIVSLGTSKIVPRITFPKPAMTARLYRFNGVWYYRFVVDNELTRGLGTSIRKGAAGLLNMKPGVKRERYYRGLKISFSWDAQPRIGTIRTLIKHLDLEHGDLLFLEMGRNREADSFIVRRGHYENETAIVKAARMLQFSSQARGDLLRKRALEWIANALDIELDSDGLRNAVRLRLSQRNENDLFELIPVHG